MWVVVVFARQNVAAQNSKAVPEVELDSHTSVDVVYTSLDQ